MWSLTELVGYSSDHAGSIVASVSNSARENTRGAREVVSTEMWECLNATWNARARNGSATPARWGRTRSSRFVEDRAAMFAGLADSTMSRDDGWRFLVLGRSVERVDMIVRLLLSRVGDKAVVARLGHRAPRSAGAHDTYLRTYRGALDAARVVQFLLLDRLFPRSVFHALRQAESCLEHLDNQPHRAGRGAGRGAAAARHGRAASWSSCGRDELLDDLPARLAACRRPSATSARPCRCSTSTSAPWVAWTNRRCR